jgi:flagellar operon protein
VSRPGAKWTTGQPAARPAAAPVEPGAFDRLLRSRLDRPTGTDGVRFSSHALQRLERRGITVDPAAMARLSAGIDRAAAKGARDSLVLMDGTAFVVSVKNRTVVTAVDESHMKERVFTNIDSAVIN